ncbi:MAG TPA: ABC transporter ATP-binding protein [Candidatus Limnocylindrales bacterium]|nr:ABC transporter ATP-binding protein [Candidatus Limnocylindrales bacterium]
MIQANSIAKSFSGKKIIENLSLEVRDEEILSLLGPNGCGKTTLLNIISGLMRQDRGHIYINGVLVSGVMGTRNVNVKPSDRKIGYVFQTISLFPHMHIEDNVAYGLKALHLSTQEVKKRTENLLDFVGLRDYARFYPSQLSGGQKQRVALARSLATEPQVLLLDEPVSTVDPQLREPFRLELKNYLQALKMTVIYVTHNLSEAFIMSDRIAVMGNGAIEQVGSKTEIFDKPSSSYVAKFLGINAIKGKAIKNLGEVMEIEANRIQLLASAVPDLIGRNVIVTIKPDDIFLSKSSASGFSSETSNIIEGTITELVQMRSNTQVTVDTGFIVKARLPLNLVKSESWSIGDKVYVYFSADSLNVFAENSS